MKLPKATRLPAAGLSFRLGLMSTLGVTIIVTGVGVLAYRSQKEQLVQTMEQAAATQAQLALTGVRTAMLENDPSRMQEMFDSYSQAPEVHGLFLLDAEGSLRVRTGAASPAPIPEPEDVLCEGCPLSYLPFTNTTVVPTAIGPVLRAITPIKNQRACHGCHDPTQTLLGVLGVDLSMAPVESARTEMIRRTVLWGVLLSVLVLLAVGAVVQFGAIRRLRPLREATQSLTQGHGAPSPTARGLWGPDEISALAGGIRAVTDSLESTRAEADQQRRLLADLINGIDDGIAVLDRRLKPIAVNRAHRERVQPEEPAGHPALRPVGDGFCGHCEPGPRCPTSKAFRTGTLHKHTFQRRAADGSDVFYEVFSSPITNTDGEVDYVVEVWRDVTERMHLQAKLAHSEQLAAVGVLASGFSHEIATPLATIGTSIQGMLRRLRGRDEVDAQELTALRGRLETAATEVFRCRDILKRLLVLSRDSRSPLGRVDLSTLAEHMLDVLRPTAEEKRISLTSAITSGLTIHGRSDQLQRLLLNFLINAVQATHEGGEVSVSVTQDAEGVVLGITDTGVGIPPEDQEHIFAPFFSRRPGGTGLGLYLNRQVIDQHDGHISVTSTVGAGTTFSVTFPKASDDTEREPVNAESVSEQEALG